VLLGYELPDGSFLGDTEYQLAMFGFGVYELSFSNPQSQNAYGELFAVTMHTHFHSKNKLKKRRIVFRFGISIIMIQKSCGIIINGNMDIYRHVACYLKD
jgi:hypothetical protein